MGLYQRTALIQEQVLFSPCSLCLIPFHKHLNQGQEAVAVTGGSLWEGTRCQGPERGQWVADHMQKKGPHAGSTLPCYLGTAPRRDFPPG